MASISKRITRDNAQFDENDQAMAQFLEHRYGDGLVYLQNNEDRALLRRAIQLGFVNEEGYLTPAGYRFCHQGVYGGRRL